MDSKLSNSFSNKYIFCPSGSCFKTPEIYYSNNPLENKLQFKCECNNNKIDMNLKDFLEKSSHLSCFVCKKRLIDDQIYYCRNCKLILDINCVKIHQRFVQHDIQSNDNIFNCCPEHKTKYIFRCIECNKSICCDCDLEYHDNNNHSLIQLINFSIEKNDFDKIKNIFEKQKNFLEKIKNIYNNLIQTLENDIQIKERIINNYLSKKFDYNSYLNMKNIYIHNNEIYEKILENIFINYEKINKENPIIENTDFINNFISLFYYSLMINKDEILNNSLISELSKKILNIQKNNNNISKTDTHMFEEKINNCNDMINNSNLTTNLNSSINYNKNEITPNINFINISQINAEERNINNINKKTYFKGITQENKKILNSSKNKENNHTNIQKSSLNKSYSYVYSPLFLSKNNIVNSIFSNSANLIQKPSSEKNIINNQTFEKLNSSNKKKETKRTPKKEERVKKSENKEDDSNEESEEDIENKNDNNNIINNMIILKSGNIAVSLMEAIEIYDLRKLDYSGVNSIYNNEIIKKNCLLLTINLIKGKKINYVFELFDGTLLCATYSKIFRIKLLNNDLNYEIISFIRMEKGETSTKIISLGTSFLVILTEIKSKCNIKLYKINENNDILDNKNSIEKTITNNIEDNCDDVPAIGNCGLYINKEINEDTSFELIKKNINYSGKLWVSIFPIEKNNKDNNSDIQYDNYLYEFISTSNAIYDYGKSRVVFYGIKKNYKGDYYILKIKEINGLSCSIEPESICQINDKYLCIGLQKQKLNHQISGFAFIDIIKRDISRIIYDNEISCLCYNTKNNLLFASMEINNEKKSYFSTKIYKIIQNKSDKGNDEIELKKIYQYNSSKHTDTITSIQQMTVSYFKINLEKQNIMENIIFVTSSKDSTLEVVKAELI